jgi:hypothetical protein
VYAISVFIRRMFSYGLSFVTRYRHIKIQLRVRKLTGPPLLLPNTAGLTKLGGDPLSKPLIRAWCPHLGLGSFFVFVVLFVYTFYFGAGQRAGLLAAGLANSSGVRACGL